MKNGCMKLQRQLFGANKSAGTATHGSGVSRYESPTVENPW